MSSNLKGGEGRKIFLFKFWSIFFYREIVTRITKLKDKKICVRTTKQIFRPCYYMSFILSQGPGMEDFSFYLGCARRSCALAPLSPYSPLPVSSEASHPLCWAHSISNIRYIFSPGIWSSSLPSWSASSADGTLNRVWKSPDRSGPRRRGKTSRTAARPNRSEEEGLYSLSRSEWWWWWWW